MQPSPAEMPDTPTFAPAQVPKTRRFKTLRVVGALIIREIASRDSRTSLGFLWSLIDPIGTVIILSFAFSILLRNPRLGTNFPLYYVTGVVPFHMYSQLSGKISSSIRYSRQLLGFPTVTILDAIFARFALNATIHVLVFVVLSSVVVWWNDLNVNVNVPLVALSLSMAAALALGIGAFNSVLFVAYPGYENFWSMFNRPMLLASGVMILIEDLPDYYFHILWWNPIAAVVATMRAAFYPNYDISWTSPLYTFSIAALAFALGLVMLRSFVHDALDR